MIRRHIKWFAIVISGFYAALLVSIKKFHKIDSPRKFDLIYD